MYKWIKERIGKIDKGVAALEFAILLPFMLITLIGLYDVSELIFCNNKMNRTAQEISNIVTRGPVTQAQLNTMLQASVLIAQPFNFTQNGNVVVTAVGVPDTPVGAKVKVLWQDSYPGGAGGSQISAASVPAGITLTNGQAVIFTEVFYNFTPLLPGYILSTTPQSIYAVAAAIPRQGDMTALSPG